MVKENLVKDVVKEPYKYGFVTDIETEKIAKGLNEDIIRLISKKKEEPKYLLDFRLKAFKKWQKMKEPDWAGLGYKQIDYQNIIYFSAPKQKEKISSLDEVDPKFQLIKGGGACHVREKLVASKANQLLIVVDETKLVQNLNQSFPLPVEVLPNAWKQVQEFISDLNGSSSLRMATKKAGPIVTDQGNLILDVLFNDGIKNPKDIEMKINNIPGVLENGLFVDLTDKVLVGKIENDTPLVYSPSRAS